MDYHNFSFIHGSPKGTTSGSRGGPLPPRFLQNHAVFRQFKGVNLYFEQILGSVPPLGVKTPLGFADENPGSAPGSHMYSNLSCIILPTSFEICLHVIQRIFFFELSGRHLQRFEPTEMAPNINLFLFR